MLQFNPPGMLARGGLAWGEPALELLVPSLLGACAGGAHQALRSPNIQTSKSIKLPGARWVPSYHTPCPDEEAAIQP